MSDLEDVLAAHRLAPRNSKVSLLKSRGHPMTAQDVALLVLTQVAVLVAGGLVAWTAWDVGRSEGDEG